MSYPKIVKDQHETTAKHIDVKNAIAKIIIGNICTKEMQTLKNRLQDAMDSPNAVISAVKLCASMGSLS